MSWTPYEFPHNIEKLRRTQERLNENEAVRASMNSVFPINPFLAPDTNLTWMDGDVCDMLAETYSEVPDWSPATCMPGETGFIAFEKPFFNGMVLSFDDTFRTDHFRYVPVHAVSWARVGGDLVAMAWSYPEFMDKDTRSETILYGSLEPVASVTLKGDVVERTRGLETKVSRLVGSELGETMRPTYPAVNTCANELRNAVGAIWLLMAQPRVLDDAEPVTARVRQRRGGTTTKADVKVSVRTLSSAPSGASLSTGRKATTRWWVRGHWRQQPCGPNRSLRKPMWIAPPHRRGSRRARGFPSAGAGCPSRRQLTPPQKDKTLCENLSLP